jgi:DNA primase
VAGRILKEDIDALRQQADIVAVIGDYTQLRRGGRSFKGLCPFHTEKTPSFTCTPDGNFFHCFGCGASGDIYDFLQRVEGMDFPEAVETLARRTGFPLRYEQLSNREKRAIGERSRLIAVSHLARDHFVRRLLGEEGTAAREYLKSRGFGRPEADVFELGLRPRGVGRPEPGADRGRRRGRGPHRHRRERAQRPRGAARPLPWPRHLPHPRSRRRRHRLRRARAPGHRLR